MRSAMYEQVLSKQGVAFHYEEKVPLENINIAGGLRNQARLGHAIDEELVEQYLAMLKDGSEPPAVVLWKPTKNSKAMPVDGNQRLQVFTRVKKKEIDAYLLDITDQMIVDRISWTFNNLVNGKRLTYEECMEHALTFVRKYGMTVAQAAKEWGVNRHTLMGESRVADSRDILSKRNIKHQQLTMGVLANLASLSTVSEDLFVKAALACRDNGLSSNDALDLVREVKPGKNEKEKMKRIDEFMATPQVTTRKAETKGGTRTPRNPLPRDLFLRYLKRLHFLQGDYNKSALLPPAGVAFSSVRDIVIDVIERLEADFGLGTQRKAVGE